LNKFEFILNGPPVSQQIRRRERLREWQAKVRQEAEIYWPLGAAPIDGFVVLQITYFYHSVKIDVDNIIKPIQDALIGLAYMDDDQITDVIGRKRNLYEDFITDNITSTLIEGFARNNEFLYIVITNAPDHEVLV
jgi:crossover junction endodeoxyribonuclease RusA